MKASFRPLSGFGLLHDCPMTTPIRLLICNWRYEGHSRAGGAEYWTQQVAEGLVKYGYEVTVLTARVRGRPSEEEIRNVKVIRKGGMFSLYWFAYRMLKRVHYQFDVVLDEVNTRPFFAAFHSTVPALTMFHQTAEEVWDLEAPFPLNVLGRRVLEKKWLRRYCQTEVLALSESTAGALKRFGVTTSRVIEPGVEQRVDFVSKASDFTVCFVGRLVPSKRPDHAIEAFRQFRQKHPKSRLIVIGDGPMREQLENGAVDGVKFVGYVSSAERDRLIATSHVLIATSVREGWGMIVTEASVVGTLSVAYDVDGLRDSIRATGGILVKESPTSLASALSSVYSDMSSLKPHAYTRTWETVCSEIDEEIERLLSRQ